MEIRQKSKHMVQKVKVDTCETQHFLVIGACETVILVCLGSLMIFYQMNYNFLQHKKGGIAERGTYKTYKTLTPSLLAVKKAGGK